MAEKLSLRGRVVPAAIRKRNGLSRSEHKAQNVAVFTVEKPLCGRYNRRIIEGFRSEHTAKLEIGSAKYHAPTPIVQRGSGTNQCSRQQPKCTQRNPGHQEQYGRGKPKTKQSPRFLNHNLPHVTHLDNCQKATALAAATLRLSTPWDMGILTV